MKDAISLKFVLAPTSLVGWVAVRVVQYPLSVHMVKLPIAIVVSPVLIVEDAQPVPHPIQLHPMVL